MTSSEKVRDLTDVDVDVQLPPVVKERKQPTGATIYAAPIEGFSEDAPQAAASQAINLGNHKGPSAGLLRLVLRVAAFNRRKLLLSIIDGEEFTWTSARVVRRWNEKKDDWDETRIEEQITETPTLRMRMDAWDLLMKHGLGGNGISAVAPGSPEIPTIIKEVAHR